MRSEEQSGTSCSPGSRAWKRGTGTSSSSRPARRLPSCTRIVSTSSKEDAALAAGGNAAEAAEAVRETWRALEEFNLNPSLALEALFVRVHRALEQGAPALS